MAYGGFKDLPRSTASKKILHHKAFNIVKNLKYDGYQRGLASMVYKHFDKKSSGSGAKSEIMSKQQLTEELYKSVIRKFEKCKVHSSFIDNVWGADLADMQLINKFIKGIRFLLRVIDIFSVPLKDKKYILISNAFQYILDKSNCKLDKL